MFLGLPDPNLLVRYMDPDPGPSIIKQNSTYHSKNIDLTVLTSLGLYV